MKASIFAVGWALISFWLTDMNTYLRKTGLILYKNPASIRFIILWISWAVLTVAGMYKIALWVPLLGLAFGFFVGFIFVNFRPSNWKFWTILGHMLGWWAVLR